MKTRPSWTGWLALVCSIVVLGGAIRHPHAPGGGCVHLNTNPTVITSATVPGTPIGITTDLAGDLIVATSEGKVMSLGANCTVLGTVTLPGTAKPVAITMTPTGDIYVAKNDGTVHRLNTAPAVVTTQTITGPGTLVDITVDPSGIVYVITSAGVVHKRTADLAPLTTGTVSGTPTAIFADLSGNLFVTTSSGTVYRLNTALATLASGPVPGSPIDVSANAAGNTIVATSGGVLHSITASIAVLKSRTLTGSLVGVDLDDAGDVVTANASGMVFLANTGLTSSTSVSAGTPVKAIVINTTGSIYVVGGTGTVSAPVVTFSSSSLSSSPDPVLAGQTGIAVLDVGNTGTGPLSITSAALSSGDPAGTWTMTPTVPPVTSVSVGGTQTFTVTLHVPAGLTSDATYNASLTINSNDPSTPSKVVPITGHGHRPRAEACYSTSSLAFGSVNTGSPPKTLPFVVTNCGDLPLQVQSVVLNTAAPAVWSISPAVPPLLTLQPMETKQVDVTLSVPAGLISDVLYSANIHVTTNDQINPPIKQINASGTGHVPVAKIDVDPTYFDIDYRDVELGYRFSRPLVIRNLGDLSLNFQISYVDPVDIDRPDFALETDPGSFSIPPFGQLIFKETFAPTSVGTKSITLRVHNTNDATFSSLDLALHGEGTPPVPIDVAFVLDRSGSMSGTAGELVKIEALRRSGILFTDLLRDGVDYFGLTKYDHENANILDLGPIATVRGAAQTRLSEINDLSGIKPRGSTGIGGAMRTATTQFDLFPHPGHKKVMIVLTDGIENETPSIREVLNGDASHPPLFTQFPDLLTYSIGLGVPANINADRLQEITNRGAGGTYHVTGDLTGLSVFNLENFYFKIFADAIGQAIVVDPTYSVGLGSTLEVPIPIITEDREALFFFIGELPQQAYVFELVDPAGQVLSSSATVGGMSVQLKQQNNWSFFRVKFPPAAFNTAYVGTWRFRVRIGSPSQWTSGSLTHVAPGGDFGKSGFHRMSVAASVGSSYQLAASVGPGIVQVGDPITMRASLTDGGWPSPDATVSVSIHRPDGNVALMTLADDGAHGDDGAHDGIFAQIYAATQPGGVYSFHFRSDGTTERGEAVKREALRSQFVGTPSPDPQPEDCISCWLKRLIVILVVLLLIAIIFLVWLRYRPA